jgi:hypothetical protein
MVRGQPGSRSGAVVLAPGEAAAWARRLGTARRREPALTLAMPSIPIYFTE